MMLAEGEDKDFKQLSALHHRTRLLILRFLANTDFVVYTKNQ